MEAGSSQLAGTSRSVSALDEPVLHNEVEVKLSLEIGAALPDFSAVAPAGSASQFVLDAVYFDTPSLALASSGSTLRRRSGGGDSGWHLKVKGTKDSQRNEFQGPIEGARPPLALRRVLPSALCETALVPVARVRTVRREIPLYAPNSRVLALVCDDLVWATAPDAVADETESPSWREIEVELVHGDREFLAEVERLLVAAGAARAEYGSKLDRALDLISATAPDSIDQDFPTTDSMATVAAIGVIQSQEQQVLSGEPGSVLRTKAAIEQLRSLLLRPEAVTGRHRFVVAYLHHELLRYQEVLNGHEETMTTVLLEPWFELMNDALIEVASSLRYGR